MKQSKKTSASPNVQFSPGIDSPTKETQLCRIPHIDLPLCTLCGVCIAACDEGAITWTTVIPGT